MTERPPRPEGVPLSEWLARPCPTCWDRLVSESLDEMLSRYGGGLLSSAEREALHWYGYPQHYEAPGDDREPAGDELDR
jgi:hypothetical protein